MSIQDADESFVSPESVVLTPVLRDIVAKHRRAGGVEVASKVLWSWFKTHSPPTNLEPLDIKGPKNRRLVIICHSVRGFVVNSNFCHDCDLHPNRLDWVPRLYYVHAYHHGRASGESHASRTNGWCMGPWGQGGGCWSI